MSSFSKRRNGQWTRFPRHRAQKGDPFYKAQEEDVRHTARLDIFNERQEGLLRVIKLMQSFSSPRRPYINPKERETINYVKEAIRTKKFDYQKLIRALGFLQARIDQIDGGLREIRKYLLSASRVPNSGGRASDFLVRLKRQREILHRRLTAGKKLLEQ
ncbi:MAG: hypothetical protein V1776_01030 [Candidatus Diapherotrites archaeon]